VLADDAFWLFHDEGSGRSRISVRSVGVALGAALLAELAFDRLLEVSAELVRPVSGGAAAAALPTGPVRLSIPGRLDAASAEVLARVTAETEVHPVRDWLAVLSLDSARLVGHRMVADGVAVERGVRRGLRREVMFVAVDPISAAWPAARLSTGVRGLRGWEPADVFLLGLVAATPLGEDLLADAPALMRERALGRLAGLPRSWQELLETTRVTVASRVMANRT
jgi:hypothetical protein